MLKMAHTLVLLFLFLVMFFPTTQSTCETRGQDITAWYRAGNTNDDFFTISQSEMTTAGIPGGRYYRGVVGYLWTTQPSTNGVAMNRYVTNNMGHFYTTNSTVEND